MLNGSFYIRSFLVSNFAADHDNNFATDSLWGEP